MKTAIVHDWLVTNGGAEKVLHEITALFPHAEIYSLVNYLSPEDHFDLLGDREVHTSYIQNLPGGSSFFRNYLPLFPHAIESWDLSAYDLILSSSWAVAKGVKKGRGQRHFCYCHTPIRYAWDLYDEYTSNLSQPKKYFVEKTLKSLRRWDRSTLERVDHFAANSHFVQERIRRIYQRESQLIYPPVNTEAFQLHSLKDDYYLTASRLVPYKKTSLIVEAFNRMPDKKLIVIGGGEEYEKLRTLARPNIEILGHQPREVLIDYMQRARAFVYAAIEDFGIVLVEAMSCGTPVIALSKGGGAETVKEGKTGICFDEQTPRAIIKAVKRFESMDFDPLEIHEFASHFDSAIFRLRYKSWIDQYLSDEA